MAGFDFPAAYRRYVPPIRAKCRRVLRSNDAAEDVVQETFVRLWRANLPHDAGVRTVMAWLYRTCTRLSIDALRSQKNVVEPSDAILPCGGDIADRLSVRAAIVALRDVVPEEELDVVLLARIDGLSHAEITVVLGISERTVRRRLERFDERVVAIKEEFFS